MKTVIYQIYYSEETKAKLLPNTIPFNNTHYEGKPLCKSLESNCIVRLFDSGLIEPCVYLGILSWKFPFKIPMKLDGSEKSLQALMEADNYSHGVYTFFQADDHRTNMWIQAEKWHKGIIQMAETIFRRMGIEINLRELPKMPFVYQNHHVSRMDIYSDFVFSMLKPFVNILENDEDLQEELNKRNPYNNHFMVEKKHLLQTMGQPHYTMHPFIAERLFSTYLCLNPQIKVKQIYAS